ncbi:MAG: DUF1080 domain-containing protein [Verrucomicrobiota bacterium]
MKRLALFFALTATTYGEEWISLFDGETLAGWTAQGPVNWAVEDGTITASEGEISLLTTAERYLNYELEVEFKAPLDTNSGIFLNSEPVVENEATDCYEINIAPPTNPFPTGSVVKFLRKEGLGEKDEWRSYRLQVQKGVLSVTLDGEKLYELTVQSPRPAGHIGLQFNRGKIAFRNIRLRLLE